MPVPPPEIAPVVIIPSQIGVWTAALTAAGVLLTAIGTIIGAFLSFINRGGIKDAQDAIHNIHIDINHRMDELLLSATKSATAEGHAAGVSEEQKKARDGT